MVAEKVMSDPVHGTHPPCGVTGPEDVAATLRDRGSAAERTPVDYTRFRYTAEAPRPRHPRDVAVVVAERERPGPFAATGSAGRGRRSPPRHGATPPSPGRRRRRTGDRGRGGRDSNRPRIPIAEPVRPGVARPSRPFLAPACFMADLDQWQRGLEQEAGERPLRTERRITAQIASERTHLRRSRSERAVVNTADLQSSSAS